VTITELPSKKEEHECFNSLDELTFRLDQSKSIESIQFWLPGWKIPNLKTPFAGVAVRRGPEVATHRSTQEVRWRTHNRLAIAATGQRILQMLRRILHRGRRTDRMDRCPVQALDAQLASCVQDQHRGAIPTDDVEGLPRGGEQNGLLIRLRWMKMSVRRGPSNIKLTPWTSLPK
jgi:hypothetical protein